MDTRTRDRELENVAPDDQVIQEGDPASLRPINMSLSDRTEGDELDKIQENLPGDGGRSICGMFSLQGMLQVLVVSACLEN